MITVTVTQAHALGAAGRQMMGPPHHQQMASMAAMNMTQQQPRLGGHTVAGNMMQQQVGWPLWGPAISGRFLCCFSSNLSGRSATARYLTAECSALVFCGQSVMAEVERSKQLRLAKMAQAQQQQQQQHMQQMQAQQQMQQQMQMQQMQQMQQQQMQQQQMQQMQQQQTQTQQAQSGVDVFGFSIPAAGQSIDADLFAVKYK
jgi:hypothetical protein